VVVKHFSVETKTKGVVVKHCQIEATIEGLRKQNGPSP
jgi:hypothetical protein